MSRDGVTASDLQIRSGQPDEQQWLAAADFALEQASLFETGSVDLSDLTLSATGRMKSEQAMGRLQHALAHRPSGLSAGPIDVEPVRITPYSWNADFDGARIAISGYVPEAGVVERLRTADVSGIPVATGLSLASGAPEGFADQAALLVQQLAQLDKGEARIVDGVSYLVGVPPSIQVAQAVTEALSGTNSIVQLAPPPVADYWLTITRQSGGTLVFDGYVPDEATRKAFGETPGADVNFLKLGAGAPQSYQGGADFGLDLLGFMSDGRVSIAGATVSVSGTAESPTDYQTLRDKIANDLPQGLSLGEVAVQPPRAATYVFSVERNSAGDVTVGGMLPSPEFEAELMGRAGASARSKVSYASGEKPNFAASAEQALQFLPWLRRGTIRFDGIGWTVEGEPASAIDKGSIETEFAVRGLAQAGWTLALSAPAEPTGFADPYLWSAERLPDGSFLFAGNVPAPSVKSWLAAHIHTRVADTSVVAHGAPEGFANAVRTAVDALLLLDQGRIEYDGDAWSAFGSVADTGRRDQALGLLVGLTLPENVDIAAPATTASEPYNWVASKSGQGVRLEGWVPAESLQRFLAVRAGTNVEDRTALRPDAPDGFASDVLHAMDILALLDEGQVAFDGTEWAASGTALGDDVDAKAKELLGPAAPFWTLSFTQAVAQADPATESQPLSPADYTFAASKAADGGYGLSGQVPAEATVLYLANLTGASTDGLAVAGAAPDGFAQSLRLGMQSLMQMQSGELRLKGGTWTLAGQATTAESRAAIEAETATLGDNWSVELSSPSNLAACQAQLAELSAHNAILFQSGAAIIAESAASELDAFAQALMMCPDAAVDVEGHTDSDGDDGRNMALSVARAEAVVNALIERGVSPMRLYAIGYGETQPIADNDTSDGKRRNRRIVVSVRDAGSPG